jgi:hypothetical protein
MLGIEVPHDVARRLAEQLLARGVVASVRGNSLRISPTYTPTRMTSTGSWNRSPPQPPQQPRSRRPRQV